MDLPASLEVSLVRGLGDGVTKRKTFRESTDDLAQFLHEWMRDQSPSISFSFKQLKRIAHYRGQDWLLESALKVLMERKTITVERDLNLVYLIDNTPASVV